MLLSSTLELLTPALLLIAYSPLLPSCPLPFHTAYNPSPTDWEYLLGWDDRSNFVTNRLFSANLTWQEWARIVFMTTKINVYEPVAWCFKWSIFVLNGHQLESITVRRTSLALHLLNTAVLLPRCVTKFLNLVASTVKKHEAQKVRVREIHVSVILCSAFFAVHPVNVEVIGWPSAQSYLLAAAFALLSTLCFLRYLETRVKRNIDKTEFLAASVLFYALSALSKGAFILLPVAFAGCCLTLEARENHPGVKRKQGCRWEDEVRLVLATAGRGIKSAQVLLPAFAYLCTGAAILGVVIFSNLDGMDPYADTIELSWTKRMIKIPVTQVRMLGQLLYPCELRPHYCLSTEDLEIFHPSVVYASSALIVVTLLSLWRSAWCFISWIVFVALSLPTLGILQHGLISESADRYCYLPFLALTPGLAFMVKSQVFEQWAESRRKNILPVISAFLILLCCASITHRQIQIWRSEEQMLLYSISTDKSDWRMIDIYAEYLYMEGRHSETSDYIALSRIHSPPPEQGIKACLHHAKLHVMQGDLSAACDMYEELYLKLKSSRERNGMVWNNVAICRLRPSIELNRAQAMQIMHEGLEQRNMPMRRVEVIEKNIKELEQHSGKVVQPTQDRMENEAMQNTDMDQGRVGSVFKAMARKETTISIFRFAESAKS